ncbi:MAG: hypothetical protein LC687_03975 [Actinobacteria bacterium]|nr:hypothetical protein [Actinomycetota bacterium]MCA1806998.1 hypothetical protein [Actinomycetota bacterium]
MQEIVADMYIDDMEALLWSVLIDQEVDINMQDATRLVNGILTELTARAK